MKRNFLLKLCVLLILAGFQWSAHAQTTSFTYASGGGSVQYYTVPSTCSQIIVDLAGARGGNYPGWGSGGFGGRVQAVVNVTPSSVLAVYVGNNGVDANGGAGGSNSGGGATGGVGASSGGGAGGGGASDIRTITGTTAAALNSRLVTAAGGGGGAFGCGVDNGGGGGGTTGVGGFTTCGSPASNYAGSGGTPTAGGAASSGGGSAGSFGFGGGSVTYGGGGGGGWYGGGGCYDGGGGGGSSYYGGSAVVSGSTTPTYQNGAGYVNITPALPVTTASPSSLSFAATAPSFFSAPQIFTFSSAFLSGFPGSLTISAPSTSFQVSPDGSAWSSSYTVPYTSATVPTTVVYVRFSPTAIGAASGNVTITGGGAATANVAVSGTGSAACSGSPTAGTATINSGTTASGNSSTAFVLNTTGTTSAGGLTYQWQSASSGTGPFTNIGGANSIPYTYTGLAANTFFQCVVTCPSFGTATTNTVSATFTFPGSGCTPSYATSCASFPMPTGIASLVGVGGTNITDPSTGCGGTAPNYQDKTATMSVTLLSGTSYNASIGGNSYAGNYSVQVWIDFNDDGSYAASESIGGGGVTSTATSGANIMTLTIPAGAAVGTHRMRIVGNYNGCCGGVPYPTIPSCPTSSITYGETRDYKVTIQAPPASITAVPASIAFGSVITGTTSAPAGFSVISAANLFSSGLLTVSPPAGFAVSLNGTSWVTSPGTLTLPYLSGTVANTNLYVTFTPTTTGTVSGNIAITGGGVAAATNIAVTGTGAVACSATPAPGTASISPATGGPTSNFTLSLSGTSTSAGLTYQWQSSSSGTGPFTNMLGANTPTYTFVGAAGTYYQCVVSCPFASSATTNTVTTTAVTAGSVAAASCVSSSFSSMSCYSFSDWFFVTLTAGAGTTINTPTNGCPSTASAYDDETAILPSVTMSPGSSYPGTITIGESGGPGFLQVFIDFNDNGSFADAGEQVMVGSVSTSATATPYAYTITIPAGANGGTHRMRYFWNWAAGTNPLSCTSYSYGEVRDFKCLIIPSAAPCSGTPSAGIVSPSAVASCVNFSPTLFNVGETISATGISYQWQSSTTGTGAWTNVTGATGQAYLPGVVSAAGTIYYRNNVTCTVGTVTATASSSVQGITRNPIVDVSNFTSTTAGNSCSASGANVTVASTSLGTGTFTVTYNLAGANTATGNTATLTMGAATGTFLVPGSALATVGTNTVTITNITNSSGCSAAPASNNTAAFQVGTLPDVSNFTATAATTPVCLSSGDVVTLSSTSLGTTSTLTATYSLSGAATSTNNTAALTMGAASGTFNIPSSLLGVGVMSVTVTKIANTTGCSSTVASNNTSSFTVNASAPVNAVTGGGSFCTGGAGVNIGVSGSGGATTVYTLYRGATVITTVNGTSSAISFGLQSVAGTYSVNATLPSTGCVTNMTGTAVVNITVPPSAYAISGGGSYCAGSTGPVISLAGSDAGAFYQLYSAGTPVAGGLITGTGGPVSFGSQTIAGTYIAIANPGAGVGCQLNMTGSASVTINSLPTPYGVTGGGNYCSGGSGSAIGMGFTTPGVTYTLYNGAAPVTSSTGTGAAISFGTFSTTGTYTVQGTSSAGCNNAMSGAAVVGINTVPAPFTVTGGGTSCNGGAGSAVNASSSVSTATYQLYNASTATPVGAPVTGTGGLISFGSQTVAGVYTVQATNIANTCSTAGTGSATVVINPTPTQFTVTGGGAYCPGNAGSTVGLNGSTAGVTYQLYNGTTAVTGGSQVGTGSALSFGSFTAAGTYTVGATTGSGCTGGMLGTAVVSIFTAPTASTVTGGGGFCSGGTGVAIGVLTGQSGVNYTLYQGSSSIATVGGSGGALSFGSTFTVPAIYSVAGTNSNGCSTAMTGTAVVSVNPLPASFSVTGGGNYCSGTTGVPVGLSGSTTGVSYTLYNGSTAVGTAVAGTGAPVSFGIQTLNATFTVFAISTASCTATMSGSASVAINPLPAVFSVSGGGNYCAGTSGSVVGMGGSLLGTNYQLYNGSLPVGGPVPGTNGAISFGSQTATGTYTAQATSAAGCTNAMASNAIIAITALPTNTYAVTAASSAYCAGGTGVAMGLSGSQSAVTYQLYNGSALMGSATGSGGAISFGSKTLAGTYTVVATGSTSCVSNITTGATISINPLPTVFGMTGGGSYCNSVSGAAVGLGGSAIGTTYQLYNTTGTVGTPVSGTGAALNFGLEPASTYTVLASNPTGCTSVMTGAITVNMNLVPAVQSVLGGGVYCAGGAGQPITLSNSVSGVTYQIYNGSVAGTSMPGSGSPISFGLQTAVGTYTVLATNASGCTTAMSGSAAISTNAVPNIYTVSGGGNICSGSLTGTSITLAGSNTGVSYQLYNGLSSGTPLSGTGGALTFSGLTAGGSYNIVATNGSSCSSNMSGTATVGVNPLPTQYVVTGGGSYCNTPSAIGSDLGLSGSTPGVAYQLYNSGTVAVGPLVPGTGLPIDFGYKTLGGNYTVIAINTSTTCNNNMLGTPSITVNPLPLAYPMSGGGGYCNGTSGVDISLTNSAAGVSYQLYNGGGVSGSSIIGGSGAIDFGTYTAAGTYTVLATNTGTSCTNAMSGNAVVSVNALPTVYNVTGGGQMCAGGTGVNINLSSSTSGVSYQLWNTGNPVGSPATGTGGAITFGPQTLAGNYTAIATSTAGCTRNMAGSANIIVNLPPVAQPISGGGAYCASDAGVPVGLYNSATGVSYQLYNGTTASGTPVAGTGGGITFGLVTGAGNYNVIGTNTVTTCSNTMSGVASVSINALPTAYTLTGSGNTCAGGAGIPVVLSGSNSGISYQLMNGPSTSGTAMNGTGGVLNFGAVTTSGTYAVVGTNTVTGCSNYMTGSPVVNVNALPTAYLVSGGGSYCNGDAGVPVGVGGSNTGVSYQLYNPSGSLVATIPGTGGAINFANQTAAGNYTIMGVNTTTSCTNIMTGVATVTVNSLPLAYGMTGGGPICQGSSENLGMGNSAAGVSYQLFNGATPVGSAITSSSGPLDFGPVSTAGVYTVQATNGNGCMKNMSGSATVVVNSLPLAQNVTGGGSFCANGTGVPVGLGSSATGVAYQLYNGTATSGSTVAGTGNAITFGLQTVAGTYTVMATANATGCTNAMTGSAGVIMNQLPNAYAVLGMGSSYCAGGDGVHILLSSSDPGIDYTILNGTTPIGGSFAGNGSPIDFGAMTAAGIYHVVANNGSTTCSATMTGSASVQVNALPIAYAITGGGNYCISGTGSVVGLGGSNTGVSYQLYRNSLSNPVGTAVAGNSGAITFGPQMGTGTYMVVATSNGSGCSNNMTGPVTVGTNPQPAAFAVSGGGAYCEGTSGSPVGLLGSSASATYQLYNGSTAMGTAVAGNGSTISFGSQTMAGTYTVMATNATTGCTRDMTGAVTVTTKPLPAAFAVSGSGSYCSGGTGLAVGLGGSATGVNYQLYNGTVAVAGTTMAGNGGTLSFGTQTAGNYNVVATSTANGCTNMMTGSANVVAAALPTAYNVTGGGSYCTTSSSTGLPVGLSSSANGVSYQLSNGLGVVATMTGTGASISFGNQATAGTYTVLATATASGCSNSMTGNAVITVSSTVAPAVSITNGIGNSVCLGALVTFTANPVNGGSTPSYQWQVNGSPAGLGFNTYSYVPANGDVVSVAMTSNASCLSTSTATNTMAMTVSAHEMPVANVTVTPGKEVCVGTMASFAATATFGGTAPTFTWMKGGAVVGTGATYAYVPANGDVVTLKMSSNFECRLSDSATNATTMIVDQATAPAVTINANPGTHVVAGKSVTLTATVQNAGNAPTYQWFIGTTPVNGATTATYSSNNFANGDSVSCVVMSSGACTGNIGVGSVVISVSPTTGVASVSNGEGDVRLMPNPNNGDFIIRGNIGSATDQELTAEVTDMLGQVVYKGKVMTHNGNVDQKVQINNVLANGMYILNLRSETENRQFHFVISK